MSAVDGPRVGAAEDFLTDAADQEGAVAVGEVAAANAALHEGVAAEDALGGFLDEDQAVGGVAGDVGEAKVATGDADFAGCGENLVDGVVFQS